VDTDGALQRNKKMECSEMEDKKSIVQVFSLYLTDPGCALS